MKLVEWNEMRLLVRGARLAEIAKTKIADKGAPVRDLEVRFYDALIEITGKLDKLVPLPFRIEIRRIDVEGLDAVVRIARVSAAGLPIPNFLGKLFDAQVAGGNVEIEGDGPSIRIHVDRFLPPSVDVTITGIGISGEGIILMLGPGGADPREGAD